MKRKLLIVILVFIVALSMPLSVLAQDYYFSLDKMTLDVYWNADGTSSLDDYLTSTNQPGGHAIAFVDVRMPNSNFDSHSIYAEINGRQLGISSDFQGSGSSGFAVEMGANAIPAGQTGTVRVYVGRVKNVLYKDDEDENSASAVFAPLYFQSNVITGNTDITVVAEGRVFVAAVDFGQVIALDAATGKLAWQATIGARIDSPPAIHGGLCIFGAHDGWVYALSAEDGRLAWRTRVAPWERRMVAFGQVESVWPAIGAVLVRDRWVYATAGRTSESDGGVAVCALDVSTGQSRWATGIGAGTFALNEVLTMPDDKLAWRDVQIDTETGQLAGAGQCGPVLVHPGGIDVCAPIWPGHHTKLKTSLPEGLNK